MKIHENRAKNDKKIFAKILIFGCAIFAVSVGIFANVHNFANAENAENVEIAQDYTVKKLDFINFDGNSFINTKFKPTKKTSLETRFSFGKNDAENYSSVFGAQDSAGAMLQIYKSPDEVAHASSSTNKTAIFPNSNHIELNKIYDASYADGTYVFDGISLAMEPAGFSVDAPLLLGAKSMNSSETSYESGAAMFDGKIYAFSLRDDGNLVLNLVPAAKYSGCGENFTVEYGFANDLDGDGNFANDEWFGNAGDGNLTGSEEISAPECPIAPPENPEKPDEPNENPPTITEPIEIAPPNTGFMVKY